jgi:chromosome segregation ATPase
MAAPQNEKPHWARVGVEALAEKLTNAQTELSTLREQVASHESAHNIVIEESRKLAYELIEAREQIKGLEQTRRQYYDVCDEVVRLFPHTPDVPETWDAYLIKLLRELAESREQLRLTNEMLAAAFAVKSADWLIEECDGGGWHARVYELDEPVGCNSPSLEIAFAAIREQQEK